MDKRKVNSGGPTSEELDDRAAKRRKLPNSDIDLMQGETAETTTQVGLKLLETFRHTADKSGRLVATPFLTLPKRQQFPDYYEMIRMPIALDTIEAKLKRHEFPTLTTLESYIKRMIANAREYNRRGSEIFDDSERLRKALSNFMTRWNPAYKLIPGYAPFPTPLPDTPEPTSRTETADSDEDAPGEADYEAPPTTTKKARGRPPKNPQAPRKSATPALSEFQYSGGGFQGLSFQDAQEKFVDDCIAQKEYPEDDFAAFAPFVELPSKVDYADYYKVIDHPVSLKTLKKGVKGVRGKYAPTGISNYATWSAFEDEASHIWKNAFKYNEDGSDIFVLALEFKGFFTKLLMEAKKAAPDGAPKIKLQIKQPQAAVPNAAQQKFTLKFPGRPTPAAASPTPTPLAAIRANGSTGFAVSNGAGPRNPFASVTPAPSLEQLERARSASGSVPSPTGSNPALVKNEEASRNSPAVLAPFDNLRASSQSVSSPGLATNGMLPPTTPGVSNAYNTGGFAQSFNHQAQYNPPNPSFDSKWRQPGKNASDAMITNLSLATHPGLNISKHFRMDLPPSANMAQQSITINLPSTHYYLQIKPSIAQNLLDRQHKLFVTSGTQRLHAMPLIPGHPVDHRHPLFEARLLPGVNRIDIELIAALPKGSSKPPNGQEVELEKITIFANLLKA
ncbi:related to member of RSC complex [Rhynchosporium secalis]|uniref:Related to member of RSC complex n=1 Tax=Rhynchosporium secalis TaxID=38038 RepID=A0A1E1MD15_RHYSE|nr:related to member of RSC complex [Rhynchosporium secalis]